VSECDCPVCTEGVSMVGKDYEGVCFGCGERRPLGWAHVCRSCWDSPRAGYGSFQ
jgi:hypothetical protein